MFKAFIQLAGISTLFVTLTACIPETASYVDDAELSSPHDFAASLESTKAFLSNESMDGVWVAITQSDESYSWENDVEYESETSIYTHLELYSIKSNDANTGITISLCSSEPDVSTRPVFQYEFNESGNAFLIEEGGMIEDLQSSTLAVIESNNKITLSYYSTRYEELYIDSSIIESGQHLATIVKISDNFDPDLGYIEVNGESSKISCFHYAEGLVKTEISDASGTASGTVNIEKYKFKSEFGQTSISRTRASSEHSFDNRHFYVISDWPELLSIWADDEAYDSELTINKPNPLGFYGEFSAITKQGFQSSHADASISFQVNL